MNLSFDQNLKIKKINNKFNSHDFIDEETVLLHTTNRLTQPWKEGKKLILKDTTSATACI